MCFLRQQVSRLLYIILMDYLFNAQLQQKIILRNININILQDEQQDLY